MTYDVAVAGLGGMGSAILAHCAERRASVIGLEQFEAANELRASSGGSRIIRKAYFEDPAYVPLLVRSYELWRELERSTGEDILRITGLLTVGAESSTSVAGTLKAAKQHALPIEKWTNGEVQARYPSIRLLEDEVGLFEADAGALNPERAVAAHLAVAKKHGAAMRFHTAIDGWEATGDGVEIRLGDGSTVRAAKLVLALGPWFKAALESLGVSIRVQRNVQAWFSPATDAYSVDKFPTFFLDRQSLPAPLYGFPDLGEGVKAAFHGLGDLTDAEHVDREISVPRDVDPLAQALDDWMPRAAGGLRSARACLYALTPDEHFVVDRHPQRSNVVICGGFSGHGFKFSPVIGEIGAALALDGGTDHPIGFLSLQRFSTSSDSATRG